MKKVSLIIIVLATVLGVYGYWGAFTESGNKKYDEMDAMFPFFVMIFGIILLIIFSVIFIRLRKNKKK
jgi:hypothetical protein